MPKWMGAIARESLHTVSPGKRLIRQTTKDEDENSRVKRDKSQMTEAEVQPSVASWPVLMAVLRHLDTLNLLVVC